MNLLFKAQFPPPFIPLGTKNRGCNCSNKSESTN